MNVTTDNGDADSGDHSTIAAFLRQRHSISDGPATVRSGKPYIRNDGTEWTEDEIARFKEVQGRVGGPESQAHQDRPEFRVSRCRGAADNMAEGRPCDQAGIQGEAQADYRPPLLTAARRVKA